MSMNKMQLEEGTFRKRPNASVLSHRRHRADSPWCSRSTSRAPVSIYMDGCFDMKHYGHCRDELIVGFISDDEIKANKVLPVTAFCERSRTRRKPVRRSTTTVKALSMGSKLR
ncbi:ethanolamine-phosphate cytidylyltransferase-like isoform X1 [Panicum virgatum]|uniref:ethanolamine-phosphate cytidylyltransferase-like isoform X1 n=1 Tax=Panicum virgatum TaxID=38727 RepID=UPI0019D5AC5C|nr:ethanolamine-phosphate cytidylyltransferase-like isoform X1 [Panicum virgatum]